MSILIVGDVHVVSSELGDCQALMSLIVEAASRPDVERVLFLGDQHNNHNVLDSRCVAFWAEAIERIGIGTPANRRCQFLVGNHDFVTPTIMHPHSMVAHKGVADVIDSPVTDPQYGYAAMPYYPDPVKFIEDAVMLKKACPTVDRLFCHQTFVGADEGKFYAKDAVEPSAIPFGTIISGHIHKPMKFGKVLYVGAPRWRTLTDAEVAKRYIYLMKPSGKISLIPTATHCIRIYRYEDSESAPVNIELTLEQLKLADIRVTINGTNEYISARTLELKARFPGVKCRGVLTRTRLSKASESDGIEVAFTKFLDNFVAPNSTPKDLLKKEIYGRF